MNNNGESLIEMCCIATDPTFKVNTDLKFIELQKILKDYPGDLTAFVTRMKTLFDQNFDLLTIVSNRYASLMIDNDTLRDYNRMLERKIKELQAALDFQKEDNKNTSSV
jgi:hypothetical protein